MDKKEQIVLAAVTVAVGTGIYFAYRSAKKKKETEEAEAEAERLKAEEAQKLQQKNVKTSPTYTPYQLQVIALQTKIGVGTDGDPGKTEQSQTNRAVKSFYPTTFAKLGIVSPANVAQYLAAKRETATTTTTPPAQRDRVEEIWNAMGGGKPAVLRKNAVYNAMYYDSSRKVYLPTGGQFTVMLGTKLYKSTAKRATQGLIAPVTAFDKTGKAYTNKLILITPENLYVP